MSCLLILLVVGLPGGIPDSFAQAAEKPNILLFTIDSCRADRIGIYGGSEDITPNLDRWARGGTVFSQAYSVSAWTAPGLVSILSGLYPATHGVDNRDRTPPRDLPTLLKICAQAGYQVPNLNFFTFAPYYHHLGLPEIDRDYIGDESRPTLPAWLEDHAESDRPFCVWYHTTLVHQPYRPEPEDMPAPRDELEKSPGLRAVLRGAIVPLGSAVFTDDDRPMLYRLYDAEVRRVHRLFNQALEVLERKRLLDSTLVVVAADHGEELLDHGFVGHASTSLHAKLYEEIVHIPLIISWPGHVEAGKIVKTPVSQVDILPTILSLAGLDPPTGLQGFDLHRNPPERDLVFESVIAGNQTSKDQENEWVRAIRSGRWKYIEPQELYDLSSDRAERKNLADCMPERVQELRNRLQRELESLRRERSRFVPAEQSPRREIVTQCPRIYTPENGSTLDYDTHTGALLFDWRGDMETDYWIEYDIGEGDHHVAGRYEVKGNHHILGPLPQDLWGDLKAWNPFRIRVSPKQDPPCWSEWVEFHF